MPFPQEERKYTYVDYLILPEDERWEIIDGVPYLQAAPTWQHQAIVLELGAQFLSYFRGKPCRVFVSPFDLCIPEYDESDEAISNLIAQPDIVVICDDSKLRKTGYFGVPSLVIEVSSPCTAKKDKVLKFKKFQNAGIKEYWIVEPEGKFVSVFTMQEYNYRRRKSG